MNLANDLIDPMNQGKDGSLGHFNFYQQNSITELNIAKNMKTAFQKLFGKCTIQCLNKAKL